MENILTTLKMIRKNTEKIIAEIILKSSSCKQAAGCTGVRLGCLFVGVFLISCLSFA